MLTESSINLEFHGGKQLTISHLCSTLNSVRYCLHPSNHCRRRILALIFNNVDKVKSRKNSNIACGACVLFFNNVSTKMATFGNCFGFECNVHFIVYKVFRIRRLMFTCRVLLQYLFCFNDVCWNITHLQVARSYGQGNGNSKEPTMRLNFGCHSGRRFVGRTSRNVSDVWCRQLQWNEFLNLY